MERTARLPYLLKIPTDIVLWDEGAISNAGELRGA